MPAAAPTKPSIPDQEVKERGRRWIYGIEVFAAGRWNFEKYGVEWTPEHLAGMERAFVATLSEVEPVVITNHGKDADGGQNRGFVGRVYRDSSGRKLLADMLVDADLYEDMKAARYRRPSVELFPDYRHEATGEVHPWAITAVSVQGGKHLEAVRTLSPIARTLALQTFSHLPLHFRHGGKAIEVTFDQGDPSMDEVVALLKQLIAGQEQLLKGIPKTAPPAPEMAAKPEEEQPKMDAGGGASSPTVTAPAPAAPASPASVVPLAPQTPAAQREPAQVVLKYGDARLAEVQQELNTARDRLGVLEFRDQVRERAAAKRADREGLRARVAKFAEEGNRKFAPALVDTVTDAVLAIPPAGEKLTFSDAAGVKKEGTPRDAFFSVLEALPSLDSKMRRQGADLPRPLAEPSDALQFEESILSEARARNISEDQAWEQAYKNLSLEQKARMAGMLE